MTSVTYYTCGFKKPCSSKHQELIKELQKWILISNFVSEVTFQKLSPSPRAPRKKNAEMHLVRSKLQSAT